MAGPFNFHDQPSEGHFDKVIPAVAPHKTSGPDFDRVLAIQKAVAKALRYSRSHPGESVACKLSFSSICTSVVPIHSGMSGDDIFTMNMLVRNGEVISAVAKAFGEEKKVDFYNEHFQKVVQEIGTFAPEAIRRLNNGIEKKDFNAIHGSLLELHMAVLIQMEDLYGTGPKVITVAYQHAARPLIEESRKLVNNPAALGL